MKNYKRNGLLFGLTGMACAGILSGVVLAQTSPTPAPSASPSASPSAGVTTQRQVFQALLSPSNPAASSATATARIVLDGGNVGVFIEGNGLAPGVVHPQHIHLGTTCADLSADTNGDGYIDPVEATPISGPEAVPLTLGPAGAAATNYPVAAQDGNMTYLGSFALAQVQSALSAPMPVVSTSPSASATPAATASPGTNPGSAGTTPASFLEGRVIEIHGVGSDVTLPSTVAADPAMPGASANETLPVACGVIHQTQE